MKKPRKQKRKVKPRGPRPGAARAHVGARGKQAASFKLDLGWLLQHGRGAVVGAEQRLDELGLMARSAQERVGPALTRLRQKAGAVSLPYSPDEREIFALLFLPFLLLASAIVISQSVRRLPGYVEPVAIAVPEQRLPTPEEMRRQRALALPSVALPSVALPPLEIGALQPSPLSDVPAGVSASNAPEAAAPAAEIAAANVPSSQVAPVRRAGEPVAPLRPEPVAPLSAGENQVALLGVPPPLEAPDGALRVVPPVTAPLIGTLEDDGGSDGQATGMCLAPSKTERVSLSAADSSRLSASEFGLRLAAAARDQVDGFVIYNDAYRTISYPMGDVPAMFGVCTDVIVRAYRALGLDLQALVQNARVGTGDRNIDHRRVEVLRRFFMKEGESLPITTYAEDYQPGDIVTYYRPQNQHTRSHIAVVSSVRAASGRLMIIHNRGWGPQLEDGLFVDQITGHYRYMGPRPGKTQEATSRPGKVQAPIVAGGSRALTRISSPPSNPVRVQSAP